MCQNLPGENIGKIVIIRNTRESGHVCSQCQGGEGISITAVPADKFCRNMRGIGGTAAISKEQDLFAIAECPNQ